MIILLIPILGLIVAAIGSIIVVRYIVNELYEAKQKDLLVHQAIAQAQADKAEDRRLRLEDRARQLEAKAAERAAKEKKRKVKEEA